jgi:hypothetical protein
VAKSTPHHWTVGRCLLRVALGGAITAAWAVLMAAAAQAADGEYRNGFATTTSKTPGQPATVSTFAKGRHQAEPGPTTSSEQRAAVRQSEGRQPASSRGSDADAAGDPTRKTSTANQTPAHGRANVSRVAKQAPSRTRSVVRDAVADSTDTEPAADTAPGHLSESGGEKTGPPTGRVVERARSVHQEVANQLRDPAGGRHRAGDDVIEATQERPDPVVAGGREAVEVVKDARDMFLSRVHDTVHDRVGDSTDHVHDTIAETRERVDRTRGDIPPDGRPCEGPPPARSNQATGVELPADQASGAQRHPQPASPDASSGVQPGRLGITTEGATPGQQPAHRRTGAEPAVWRPANPASNPACPAGLDACTFTAASANVQSGPDQRRTSGLAHVTRPSALGSPGGADRRLHDAWKLPSSPAFVPAVSPD